MTVTSYTKAKVDQLLAAITGTLAGKADTSALAPVATSGAYTDLTAKPTIPATAADIGAQPAGDYATNTDLSTGLAGKVNSSTYTSGLAGKQDKATLGADVASDATVRAAFVRPTINTIVYDGDSVTQIGGGIDVNPFFNGRGFWCWAQSLTGHRLRSLGNMAQAGQTTAQILARVDATLALEPGAVHLLAGTNDVGLDVAAATTQANLAAYYDACAAAGVRVIAGTIPPNDGWTSGQRQAQTETNAWLRDQVATRRGWVLVDYAAAVTDPDTGGYVPGYAQSDGTHPSQPGAQAMGRVLAASILSLNPPAPLLLSDPNDATNLFTAPAPGSGRFAGGTWTQGGTAATLSKVARTDGVAGSWQRVVMPTGGDGYMQSPNVDSSGLHGQQVIGMVEYSISDLDPAPTANAQAFYMSVQSYNGSGFNASLADLYWDTTYENQGSDARSGVLRTPAFTVPNDSVVLQMIVHLTGGGTYDLDRASLTLA
jgi:lysophospholipase L1-like esterase